MILMLAPMEGVVDPVIRDVFTKIGGYSLCVTEFVRVTNQLLPNKVFYRYCPELYRGGKTRAGVPVLVQLLGSDPNCLLENALRAVSLGAPGIDLNFGCPAKTVNSHDGGASLLKNPDRLFKIIDLLRKNIPANISVSAKVRLGFENKDLCLDIAQAVGSANASWLSVHARTKLEAYKPPAHWQYIARMKEKVDIPVFANGDIWTKQDWLECKKQSQCEDFILGRGAFARPYLAREIWQIADSKESAMTLKFPQFNIYQGKFDYPKDWQEFKPVLLEFMFQNIDIYGVDYCVKRLKQWIKFLKQSYPSASLDFDTLKRSKEIMDFISHYSANQTLYSYQTKQEEFLWQK